VALVDVDGSFAGENTAALFGASVLLAATEGAAFTCEECGASHPAATPATTARTTVIIIFVFISLNFQFSFSFCRLRATGLSGYSRAQKFRGAKKGIAARRLKTHHGRRDRLSQRSRAQFRAKSGVPAGKGSVEMEKFGLAGLTGRIVGKIIGAKSKSWFWPLDGAGAAGAGCESDGFPSQQGIVPCWQQAITLRAHAAGVCAGSMGNPASSKTQTMANTAFISFNLADLPLTSQPSIGFLVSIFGVMILLRRFRIPNNLHVLVRIFQELRFAGRAAEFDFLVHDIVGIDKYHRIAHVAPQFGA
jgi:hypothetical protein